MSEVLGVYRDKDGDYFLQMDNGNYRIVGTEINEDYVDTRNFSLIGSVQKRIHDELDALGDGTVILVTAPGPERVYIKNRSKWFTTGNVAGAYGSSFVDNLEYEILRRM